MPIAPVGESTATLAGGQSGAPRSTGVVGEPVADPVSGSFKRQIDRESVVTGADLAALLGLPVMPHVEMVPTGRSLPSGGNGLPLSAAVRPGTLTSIAIQQMFIAASGRGDAAGATQPSAGRESTLPLFAVMGGELPGSIGALALQEDATATPLATGSLAMGSSLSTLGNAPSTPQVAAAFNPFSQEGSWSQQLAQQVGLLSRTGLEQQRLQLRLDPPYLGSIDVEILARDGETQVYLNAAHGAVRDALESALPRLRELFSAEGLALAHAQVGGGGMDDRARDGRDRALSEPSQQRGQTDIAAVDAGSGIPVRFSPNQVDFYA